jgi:hypothetical protein
MGKRFGAPLGGSEDDAHTATPFKVVKTASGLAKTSTLPSASSKVTTVALKSELGPTMGQGMGPPSHVEAPPDGVEGLTSTMPRGPEFFTSRTTSVAGGGSGGHSLVVTRRVTTGADVAVNRSSRV